MKQLSWTAAWLIAAAVPTLAQERAASAVPLPQTWSTSNIWVANRGAGTVSALSPGRSPVKTFTGADGIATPWDVVYVPRHGLVVVSNNGNGTLTVIDAATFTVVQNVTVANATNLRGMSVSGDEGSVFVVGLSSGSTAVFRLDLSTLQVSPVSGISADTQAPEDCVVINASRVGGSGNGPGKIYYSVPSGNYIGVLRVNPPGAGFRILMGAGSLSEVTVPTQLARSPDHSLIFGGCSTASSFTDLHILRIVPGATDTADQPSVRATGGMTGHFIRDVAFRPGGPPFQALVNLSEIGTTEIVEIDQTGVELAGSSVGAGIAFPGLIRLDAATSQLFVGTTDLGSGAYSILDVSVSPFTVGTQNSTGNGPAAFAFSPRLGPPVVSDVWPSGMVCTAGASTELRGANFVPGVEVSLVDFSGVPSVRTTTFVDEGRLTVDVGGVGPAVYEVRVRNPDQQLFQLARYFLSIDPPAIADPVAIPIPSSFDGYQLMSVPQYASAGDLLAAIQTQFGGYSPNNIRVFVQSGGVYRELNQVASSYELAGRSFWVLSRLGGTLNLSRPHVGPALADPDIVADDKVVILQPGWNMVAQPTVNPGVGGRMAMTDVAVFSDGALTLNIGNLESAAVAADVSFPVEFVGGAYVFLAVGDDLHAGRGYWIRNNMTGPLYLTFPTSDAVAKLRAATVSAGAPRPKSAGAPDAPPPPPGAFLTDDGHASGCGLTGLELLGLFAFLRARGRRRLGA